MKWAPRLWGGLLGALVVTPGCRGDDVVLLELPRAPEAGEVGNSGVAGGGSGGTGEGGSAGQSGAEASAGTSGSAPEAGGTEGNAGEEGHAGDPPHAGSSGAAGAASFGCRKDSDCYEPSEFCQKPNCTGELGECVPRPLFCEADRNLVCGCNNITYWNACVARRAGVSSIPEECQAGALGCRSIEECRAADPDATCVRLFWAGPESCSAERGTCWVLPLEECGPDPYQWVECRPPPPGSSGPPPNPPPCVDTCTAIRSGRRHFRGLCQ